MEKIFFKKVDNRYIIYIFFMLLILRKVNKDVEKLLILMMCIIK